MVIETAPNQHTHSYGQTDRHTWSDISTHWLHVYVGTEGWFVLVVWAVSQDPAMGSSVTFNRFLHSAQQVPHRGCHLISLHCLYQLTLCHPSALCWGGGQWDRKRWSEPHPHDVSPPWRCVFFAVAPTSPALMPSCWYTGSVASAKKN